MEHAESQFASLKPQLRTSGRAGALSDRHDKTFELSVAALEHTTDAVIGLDADARVALFNGAAARLYGLDPADVLGRPFSDVITCEWRDVPHNGGEARVALPNEIGLLNGTATHVTRAGGAIPVSVSLVHVGPPGDGAAGGAARAARAAANGAGSGAVRR